MYYSQWTGATVNVLLTVAGSNKSLWFTSTLPEMFHIIYLLLLNFSMSFNMNLYNSHGKEDLMSHMHEYATND